MRTQSFHKPITDSPWLEYFPAESGSVKKTAIEKFPYTIGRNQSTDMPIDSSRVSREHAEILRQGIGYRVRDLGSTNGTFLNGERIEDAQLRDGDILVIADIEFSFYCAGDKRSRITATQIMSHAEEQGGPENENHEAREFIQGVRRLHEQLAHRSLKIRFQPIVRLEDREILGYEALSPNDAFILEQANIERQIRSVECRLCGRLQDIQRLLAAEQAAHLPPQSTVFLRLQPSEVGATLFSESLVRLVAATDKQLVAQIPDSAVCDIPSFRDFIHLLREFGLHIAYDGFAGGHVQAVGPDSVTPEYIKLAQSVVRGLDRSRPRQRQVQQLAGECRDIGCRIIATGVQNQDEANACRDAGCTFLQGEFHCEPQSIDALAPDRQAVMA